MNESIKNSSKCDERGHKLRHNNYQKYGTFVTKQVEYSSQALFLFVLEPMETYGDEI